MNRVSISEAVVTVFLVRHGRTALNAAGVLRGHLDPPLDDVGVEEAGRLGELFATTRPAAIMSSPLARAYQTASAIAVACGRTVEVDADLIDRDYGPVAGRSRNEVEREYAALDTIAGVEPLDRLAARVTAALDRLTDRTRATPLVLVAHDVVNRVLLSRLLPARFVDPEQVSQRTGCWNRLEHGAAGWRVLVVDAVPGDGRVP